MTHWQEKLLDIWRIHARINLEILDSIEEEYLEKRLEYYETAVGGQFAHIHRVRILWLQRVEGLAKGLQEIEKSHQNQKDYLRESLAKSAERVEAMLKQEIAAGGEPAYFQPHVGAFIGYLIAHECMHHGEIGMILGKFGQELPLEVVWNWNDV